MERKVPPAPTAQEALQDAKRLRDVRGAADGKRTRRRARKDAPAGTERPEPSQARRYAEQDDVLWAESSPDMATIGGAQERICDAETEGERFFGAERRQGAGRRAQQLDCEGDDVRRSHEHAVGRMGVRPPRRRHKAPAHSPAPRRGTREAVLTVAVSAATSFAVCAIALASQGDPVALLGGLFSSGWSM